MIEAFLFDLDNTLYSYNHANKLALKDSLTYFAKCTDISYIAAQKLHNKIRLRLKKILNNSPASHNRILFYKLMFEECSSKYNVKNILDVYNSYWKTFYRNMTTADNLHKVFSIIKKHNIKTAVISNYVTKHQLKKLHKLKIDKHLDKIIISEDIGYEKPHTIIFKNAIKSLNVNPKNSYMVGDNYQADILGAKKCGINTIYTKEFNKTKIKIESNTIVIKKISDLIPLITTYNSTHS